MLLLLLLLLLLITGTEGTTGLVREGEGAETREGDEGRVILITVKEVIVLDEGTRGVGEEEMRVKEGV